MCSSVSKIELKSLSDNTLFHQPAGMRSFRVSALHVGRLEPFVDSLSFKILITLGLASCLASYLCQWYA